MQHPCPDKQRCGSLLGSGIIRGDTLLFGGTRVCVTFSLFSLFLSFLLTVRVFCLDQSSTCTLWRDVSFHSEKGHRNIHHAAT